MVSKFSYFHKQKEGEWGEGMRKIKYRARGRIILLGSSPMGRNSTSFTCIPMLAN